MKTARAEAALVAVTVLWGTTFVVVKSALADISPMLLLALRFALASVALGLLFRKAVRRAGIAAGCLAGLLLFAAYVFQTTGLLTTTPPKSAFLTSLSVPLVPLAGSLVYRTRPRLLEAAGIAVATLGTVLLTAPPEAWSRGVWSFGRGDWLSFLCAVAFALHIVVTGHFAPIVGFESLVVVQTATAALLSAAALLLEPVRFHLTAPLAGAVLMTGLLATALAFAVMAWAQQYTSANRAALIFSLEPVVALATSWLVAGETLSGRGKVGAGLILSGILLVELKRSKPERHPMASGDLP